MSAHWRNSAAAPSGTAGAGGKRARLGLVGAVKAGVRAQVGTALGRGRGSDALVGQHNEIAAPSPLPSTRSPTHQPPPPPEGGDGAAAVQVRNIGRC